MSSAPTEHAPGTRAWRSLGFRLALWYVTVTLVSILAVIAVFALRTDAWVEREGQMSADATLEEYRAALEDGGIRALRSVIRSAERRGDSVALRLVDEQNVEIVTFASDDASGRAVSELEGRRQPSRDWQLSVASVSRGWRLEVLVRNGARVRLWRQARGDLWLIFAFAVFASAAGAFFISRRALAPVSELARATHRIVTSGDLGLRVPTRGSADDLDELTRMFNAMLERNETLVRRMKDSLDDVAHDLRTPLTRLRASAELALRAAPDLGRSREALADVVEESDRVLGMLTASMDVAEAETGAMRLEMNREDLSVIAREATELYDMVAAERGVRVVTHLSPGIYVQADRRRMLQVCANLLDNAIKYTPPGGTVEVSVIGDATWGIVSVADTGMGIALEDQSRVWDRLFRADRSRSERGLGLGLALVKAVVEAHAGKVRLRSELGKGSTFVIELPRAPA